MKPEFPHASEDFKKLNTHVFAKGTLGQVLLEPEERPMTKDEAKSEKQLQEQIRSWLEQHGTVVIRSRMDKKTGTPVGTPDLLFAVKGRATAFECKMSGKKLTKEQKDMILRMTENGWDCYTVYSFDQAREIFEKLSA